MAAYGPADLMQDLGVSQETCERLETHRRLLAAWSKRINLIGPRELDDYWRRHALDCGQLVAHAPGAKRWIDIGAGAGFPGVVVACLLADLPSRPERSAEPGARADPNEMGTGSRLAAAPRPGRQEGVQVTLVETNAKKAAFLREAVRETGAPARVLNEPIDDVAPRDEHYDIVTARAFAPLPRIILSAKPILDRGATGLFLKGADYRAEIAAAEDQGWALTVEALPSRSESSGRILRIVGVTRAGTADQGG